MKDPKAKTMKPHIDQAAAAGGGRNEPMADSPPAIEERLKRLESWAAERNERLFGFVLGDRIEWRRRSRTRRSTPLTPVREDELADALNSGGTTEPADRTGRPDDWVHTVAAQTAIVHDSPRLTIFRTTERRVEQLETAARKGGKPNERRADAPRWRTRFTENETAKEAEDGTGTGGAPPEAAACGPGADRAARRRKAALKRCALAQYVHEVKTGEWSWACRILTTQLLRELHAADADVVEEATREEPERIGGEWDSLIAAVVEFACRAKGLQAPEWVEDERRTRNEPWNPDGAQEYPGEEAWLPAAFLRHGTLTDPKDFDQRVNEHREWEPNEWRSSTERTSRRTCTAWTANLNDDATITVSGPTTTRHPSAGRPSAAPGTSPSPCPAR